MLKALTIQRSKAASAKMSRTLVSIPILVMSVSSTACCDPDNSAQSKPKTTERLTIIPWVELNYKTYDQQGIEGLQIWRTVTDTAIVSTRPGRADLYTKLRKKLPDMRIIPGLKPNGAGKDLLPTFDSQKGWEDVAKEISKLRETSGQKTVLLENEKAVYPYVRGEQSVDIRKLKKALGSLPDDIEYLWYPSIFGKEEEQERCAKVCQAVEDVLTNVRFLDQRFQGQRAVKAGARKDADRRLKAIASRPTLRMAYFYGPNHPNVWWKDDQVLTALSHIRDRPDDPGDVVLYPGVKRWVEAARSLTAQLQPSVSPEDP